MRHLAWACLVACTTEEDARVSALSAETAAADEVLVHWDGGELTRSAVEERVALELRLLEIDYQLERHARLQKAADALVDEALLTREAQDRGLSTLDELLAEAVDGQVVEPSPRLVEAQLEALGEALGGLSPEAARAQLRAELLERARADRYEALLAELRDRHQVQRRLAYPDLPRVEIPLDPADPALGPEDAAVVLVEFAEYQCRYCAQVEPVLTELRRRWPNELRVVFKDFPLHGHARALPAAVAAHCADDQGQFWPYHRALMAGQDGLGDAALLRHAESLALDLDAFRECLRSGRHEAGIREDLRVGRSAGVRATPTFYLNGVMIPGNQPVEHFVEVIERELSREPPG